MVLSMSLRYVFSWISILLRLGYYSLAIYGLFLLVFWYLDAGPVVQFGSGTLHPVVAKSGDSIVVEQPIKKLRNCPGSVYRYLSGDCGIFPIMKGDTILPVGFDSVVSITFEVPQAIQPGNCSFNALHQYYCNPLDLLFNRNHVSPESLHFKVVR